MIIGVPKEIKPAEYRVGLTPDNVSELIQDGHQVIVEDTAGLGSGYSSKEYVDAGATIGYAAEIYEKAKLIVKVKEPQDNEIVQLRPKQILFTYLHLAADKEKTIKLMKQGTTCIAYETIEDKNNRLPLLMPMSVIAGKMSIQIGAHYMEKRQSGSGILMGGYPGVPSANVTILGSGTSGSSAANVAIGMGANVTILDKDINKLNELSNRYGNKINTLAASKKNIADSIQNADLVIGAVLIPGAAAPKLITKDMLSTMKIKSVFVDIAIDQGGCAETSNPTSHDNPVYVTDNVIHYCVTNIPGAVSRTSTLALTNSTLPYVKMLAGNGIDAAIESFAKGINTFKGKLINENVADSLGIKAKKI